tara:strand:+ start:72 stop:1133 length:1062 start_codon:yes stop_codon:yes gene_type:complete
MKVENKKAQNLSIKTWALVQETAKGERTANGNMLFISKNMFDLFKEGKMQINQYFGEKVNNADPMNMFFNIDGTRKTLIAKDFGLFTTHCMIPALNQNLADFQKNHPYEFNVLTQASPVVMFLICNREIYEKGNFLNLETDPVQFKIDWKVLKTVSNASLSNLTADEEKQTKAENIFRNALFDNFFLKSEKGKDFFTTFRGDRGLVDFVKQYFLPKKIASENVKNAVESETFKQVKKMNDLEKGIFGTTHNLTVVAKEEQGKGGNADQRLKNEVEEMTITAEKIIDLFAKNKNPITQKALLDLHLYVVDALQTENFEEYFKTKTKAKVEFKPQINKTTFDTSTGDFWKYVSQI